MCTTSAIRVFTRCRCLRATRRMPIRSCRAPVSATQSRARCSRRNATRHNAIRPRQRCGPELLTQASCRDSWRDMNGYQPLFRVLSAVLNVLN